MMPELDAMLAAYATGYPNETDRLILADWLEEHGDERGAWLRDPQLAAVMGPGLADPIGRLIAEVTQDESRRLLLLIGSKAVPAILTELTRGTREQGDALLQVLDQIGGRCANLVEPIGQLKSDDPREQRAALDALAALGEQAAPAVPAILQLLEDDRHEIRCAAIATLGRLGSAADDALIAAYVSIDFHDVSTRQALHAAVAARGPNSPAIDLLVADLHEGWPILESATARLRELGPGVLEAILGVGVGLVEGDSTLRDKIFAFLREMPEAEEHLLTAALDRSRDEGSRAFAVQALVRPGVEEALEPYCDGLIPHLLELASDDANRVAREAAGALGRLGERAAVAVPVLTRLLHRADGSIFSTVINALSQMGSAACAALETVRPIGDAGDTPAGRSARTFVRRFADPVELAATIRHGLRSPEAEVRIANWRRLCAAMDLFPDLPDLLAAGLADPSAEVRRVAARELILPSRRYACTARPDGIDPVPLLRLLLRDAEEEVRWLAITDLSFNRRLIPGLVPDLLSLLAQDPAVNVRRSVLYVFIKHDADSKPEPELQTDEVLAAVRRALRDSDDSVRSEAFGALRYLWNPLPEEVVPDLLELARLDEGKSRSYVLTELTRRADCPDEVLDLLRRRLPRYLTEQHFFGTLMGLAGLKYTPSAEELPLLVECVQRASELELDYASELFGRVGAPAVPSLLPLLADGQTYQLRACVITALQTIGPDARPALPDLARIAVSPNPREAYCAVNAIASMAERTEIVELLRPVFRHRSGMVRTAILEIANKLGPSARPWLEELLDLTQTDGGTEEILIALVRDEPALLRRITALLEEPEPARTTARKVIAGLNATEHR